MFHQGTSIKQASERLLGTTHEVAQGPIFSQDQIARAAELGLGIKSAAQIELITDDSESEAYAAKIRGILTEG